MLTATVAETIETLKICREMEIAAPIEIAFEAVLEELGPGGQMPDGTPFPMKLEPWPGGGVWMEAVVQDAGGVWYGYFHNEVPAPACPGSVRQAPRIGAARSRDRGRTWEVLGIVLEAPPSQADCATGNQYFDGGLGDLSVQLDAASQDLYIFYSAYPRFGFRQGVGVARMAWADRDAPAGRAMVWRSRAWLPASARAGVDGQVEYEYPLPTPVFPTREPFHDNDLVVDAYWGPSVHWNTYLQRYVMLLNRAKDEDFGQEGTYVSFAPTLSDPREWSVPVKVADGGLWYPQAVGLQTGSGTDKTAGEYARYFQGGVSNHLIRFIR